MNLKIIKSYLQPSMLYRYRSLKDCDQEIQAIEGGYLHCAAYRKLNDPMEGLFVSSPGLRQSAGYRSIRESISDAKSHIGICSFSEVRNHELMWAHYADRFEGICVAYSFSKLSDALPESVEFVRMFYDERVPTIHRARNGREYQAKKALSCKNYRWLYEREWRMFGPLGRVSYGDLTCVACVYLGSRIRHHDRVRIEHRLAPLKIKTRQMIIDKYSISFEPRHRQATRRAILRRQGCGCLRRHSARASLS